MVLVFGRWKLTAVLAVFGAFWSIAVSAQDAPSNTGKQETSGKIPLIPGHVYRRRPGAPLSSENVLIGPVISQGEDQIKLLLGWNGAQRNQGGALLIQVGLRAFLARTGADHRPASHQSDPVLSWACLNRRCPGQLRR
jgi:hypothetical protein